MKENEKTTTVTKETTKSKKGTEKKSKKVSSANGKNTKNKSKKVQKNVTSKPKPKLPKEELHSNRMVADDFRQVFEGGIVSQQDFQEFLNQIEKNSKWFTIKLGKITAKVISGGALLLRYVKKQNRLGSYSDNAVLSTMESGNDQDPDAYNGCNMMISVIEDIEIPTEKVAQLKLDDNANIVEETEEIPTKEEKPLVKRGRGRPKGTTKKKKETKNTKKELRRYLLSDTGLKTLVFRLGVNCPIWSKLPVLLLKILLNLGAKVADNKEALVLVRNEKIRAVNGASTYKVLPQNVLFKNVTDVLDKEFNGAQFVGGEFTYEQTKAMWVCPEQAEDLMKKYKETCIAHGIDMDDEYLPAVEFYTSDIGEKSATVNALLKMGNSEILIGSPIQVAHLQSNTKTFEQELDGLFAQFQDLINQLEALIDIEIKYPINTLIGCAKSIKLSKGYTLEEITKFNDLWSKGKTEDEIKVTAHDVFYALQSILNKMKSDEKVSRTTCENCAENLTRLLAPSYNWKDVDVSVRPDF